MLFKLDMLYYINLFFNSILIFFCFYLFFFILIYIKEFSDKYLAFMGNSIIGTIGYFFLMWLSYLDETWPEYKYFFKKHKLYINITYFDSLGLYILFVCVISLIFCFFIIDNKIVIINKQFSFMLFSFFLIVLNFFIFTNNLFVFFLAYELLLLPSILVLFYSSVNIRVTFILKYFIVWTHAGSLILLIILAIFYNNNIITFNDFANFKNFDIYNKYIIIIGLFIGFGIKIPIFPFYFWLVRTHVEANTSFSIFLSGFLVKVALYGFFKIYYNLNFFDLNNFFLFILVVGLFDCTIKMLNQIDLKKIVALMTVQEMNIIFSFFFLDIQKSFYIVGIFCFIHFIISFSFFYFVDILYRRFKSRSIYVCYGLLEDANILSIFLIFLCFLFLSIPYTLKFYLEFYFFYVIFSWNFIIFIILIYILVTFMSIIFIKIWFNVFFGVKLRYILVLDLTKREIFIFIFIFIMFCSGSILLL